MYCVSEISLMLLIHSFSSLFVFLQFSNVKNFVALFSGIVSPRNLKVEYIREQWVDVSCIPQTSCCCLFIVFFFYISLSNFQRLKFFVTLFSGTVRPRYSKLFTHVDCKWMYSVYRNQATAAVACLFIHLVFIFLSLRYSNIEMFHNIFLQNCEAQKVETIQTWRINTIYCVYWTQAAHTYSSRYFFLFLSLQFSVTNLSFSSDSAIAGL